MSLHTQGSYNIIFCLCMTYFLEKNYLKYSYDSLEILQCRLGQGARWTRLEIAAPLGSATLLSFPRWHFARLATSLLSRLRSHEKCVTMWRQKPLCWLAEALPGESMHTCQANRSMPGASGVIWFDSFVCSRAVGFMRCRQADCTTETSLSNKGL